MGMIYDFTGAPGLDSGLAMMNLISLKALLRSINNASLSPGGPAFPEFSGYISAIRYYPFLLVDDRSGAGIPDPHSGCFYFNNDTPWSTCCLRVPFKLAGVPLVNDLPVYEPLNNHLPQPLNWSIPNNAIETWLTTQGINNFVKYTSLKIELYVPFFGFMDLNIADLLNPAGYFVGLKIIIIPDLFTGKATLAVYAGATVPLDTTIKPILISEAKIGIDIPFGINNAYEMSVNSLTTGTKMLGGIATTAVTAIGAAAMSHPYVAFATLLIGGATAIVNGITGPANIRPAITKGQTGDAFSSLELPLTPFLRIYAPKPFTADLSTRYSLIGHAAGYTAKLGDLTGFTQVANIHLEGLDGATAPELAEIEDLLKKGVIL